MSPASRKAWLATSADFEPPVPPPTLSWSRIALQQAETLEGNAESGSPSTCAKGVA